MTNINEIALAEFNAWMAGVAEYRELSPAGRACCDAYLEDHWRYMEALCEGADA